MKNVRLFAVAAALGMFASTVAAAETTSKTTVKWTGADTIIKVDLGEEVVVPTLTATSTTTTEGKECTNGTDANNDGLVDGAVYGVNPDLNSDHGWLYTNAKYWATNENGTAKWYLGLYDAATKKSGRFLAPGSEEIDEEIFVNQLGHKWYDGVDAAFQGLQDAGLIKASYDEDGELDTVVLGYYVDSSKVAHFTEVKSMGVRKSEENMIEDVVDYLTNGTALLGDNSYYSVTEYTIGNNNISNDSYNVTVVDEDDNYITFSGKYRSGANGKIVLVEHDRKGNYSLVDWNEDSSIGALDLVTPADKKVFTVAAKENTAQLVSGTKFSFSQGSAYVVATASDTPSTTKSNWVVGNYVDAERATTTVATASDFVWDGEKGVHYSKLFIIDVADAKTAKTMEKNTTYVLSNTGSTTNAYGTFDKASCTPVSGAGTLVLDDTYKTFTTPGGAIDKLAYVSKDKGGYFVLNIVDWKDAEIKVLKNNNTYVTIDETNYGTYFKMAKPASGSDARVAGIDNDTLVNGTPLKAYLTNTWGSAITSGYTGAVEHDYDYVGKSAIPSTISGAWNEYAQYGYTKTSYEGASYVGNAYGNMISATTTLYPARTVTNPAYNQLTKLGDWSQVVFVDITDIDKEDYAPELGINQYMGATVVAKFNLPKQDDKALKSDFTIVVKDDQINLYEGANKTAGLSTLYTGGVGSVGTGLLTPAASTTSYGWYELEEIPANDTEYYVLLTDKAGLDLSGIWSYSASRGTGELETANGKEIECKAVQLEKRGAYYPAFETEQELIDAVYAITGLDTALEGTSSAKDAKTSFGKWYAAAKADLTTMQAAVDPNYSSLSEELPSAGNAPVHGGKKCEYTATTEPTEVEVTYDTTAVNTKEAGIYEIKYTADVAEGAENATATVKVVVAPKYVRTWGANGKVATLTSFYVSNPEAKYAEYKYDWTAKKVTVTYYNVDGSVSTTTVNNL